MKLFILIINKQEQYIVDDTNIRMIEEQILARQDLNFTRRNAKDINKSTIQGIKSSYITHWEIVEGEDIPDDDRKKDLH